MEKTAEFNIAYSYIISEITSILIEIQKPFASDNKKIVSELMQVSALVEELRDAAEEYSIYEETEPMLKLKNKIQQSKKQ